MAKGEYEGAARKDRRVAREQSSERVRESSGEPIDETVVSAGVKRRWLIASYKAYITSLYLSI